MRFSPSTSAPALLTARITTTSIRVVTFTVGSTLRATASSSGARLAGTVKGWDALTTGRAAGTYTEVHYGAKTGWVPNSSFAAAAISTDVLRAGSGKISAVSILRALPHAKAAVAARLTAGTTVRMTGRHRKDYTQVVAGTTVGWVPFSVIAAVKTAHVGLRTLTTATTLYAGKGGTGTKLRALRTGDDVHATGAMVGQRIRVQRDGVAGWVPIGTLARISPKTYPTQAGHAAATTAVTLLELPNALQARRIAVPAGARIWLTGREYRGWLEASFEKTAGWLPATQVGPATDPGWTGARAASAALPFRSGHRPSATLLATLPAGEDVYATGRMFGTWREVTQQGRTGWLESARLAALAPVTDAAQAGSAAATTATVLRREPSTLAPSVKAVPQDAVLYVNGRTHKGWLQAGYDSVSGWVRAEHVGPASKTSWSGLRVATAAVALRSAPAEKASTAASVAAGQDVFATGRIYASWREVSLAATTGWVPATSITTMSAVDADPAQTGPASVKAATVMRAEPHPSSPERRTVPSGTAIHVYGRSRKGWTQVGFDSTSGWVSEDAIIPATRDVWRGARTVTTPTPLRSGHHAGAGTMLTVAGGEDVFATGRVFATWTEITQDDKSGWVPTAALTAVASEVNTLQSGQATVAADVSLRAQAHLLSSTTIKAPQGATIWLTGRTRNDWVQVSYEKVAGWMREAQIAPLASPGWKTARTTPAELPLRSRHQESSATLLTVPANGDVLGTGHVVAQWTQVVHGGRTGWVPQAKLAVITPTVDELQAGAALAVAATALLVHPLAGTDTRIEVPRDGALKLTGRVYKDWVEAVHAGRSGWLPEVMVASVSDDGYTGVRRVDSAQALRARHWSLSASLVTIPAGADVVLTGQAAGTWVQATYQGKTGWAPASALSALAPVTNPVASGAGTAVSALTLTQYPVAGAAIVGQVPAGAPVLLTGRAHGTWAEVTAGTTTGWAAKTAVRLTAAPTILAARSSLLTGLTGATTTLDEHVARRFSPGAAPRVYDEVRQAGWRAWLTRQMAMTDAHDAALTAQLDTHLPMVNKTWKQVEAYAAERQIELYVPLVVDRRSMAAYQRGGSTVLRQLLSTRHLNEVMFEFWMDHFSMPYTADLYLSVLDIDLAMRRDALSSYPQILRTMYSQLAVYYMLDNRQNVKGRINENLGRETLELYTLGVGNYTETDVETLSVLLTGWGGYLNGLEFNAKAHVYTTTPLSLVGKAYPNATEAEARASMARFIEDMAVHPAAIRLICTKLATRFVRENPPKALVDQLVGVYQSTGGDVKKLLWAIVDSAEFRAVAGAKWKRPGEYAAGVHRALQVSWDRSQASTAQYGEFTNTVARYQSYMEVAGHRARYWHGPDGYPDRDTYWTGSSSMLQCFKLAMSGKPLDPEVVAAGTWAQLLPVDQSYTAQANAEHLYRVLTGYTPTVAQREAATTALADTTQKWTVRVDNAVRTVLTSPLAFLR